MHTAMYLFLFSILGEKDSIKVPFFPDRTAGLDELT